MRIRPNRSSGGWTLVEIMIVVSLIGMLAGIAMPSALKARDVAHLNIIYSNLRLIEDAKEQWATETRVGPGADPADTQLLPYFKRNTLPQSILGEVYSPNPLGEPASATIPVALGSFSAGSAITLP
jgi:prepilin-type N-terminal cleavage/methylation domain-containing protein